VRAEVPLVEGRDIRLALRNEPVQARSNARLTTLLDAAAAVVQEIGYERLTTAMVAQHAGASIGTVYRYFPDRIALLEGLAARNLERVLVRGTEAIDDRAHTDWMSALTAAFDVLVDAFRTEPGFRGIRSGDVLDLRPSTLPYTYNSVVANRLLDGLIARFGVVDTPELRFRFELAIEVADALAARAFARNANGDPKVLEVSRNTVREMLSHVVTV
jgi:AcrR family transcriptional regulator